MTEEEWLTTPNAGRLCDETRERKTAWKRGAWGRKLTLAWCYSFRQYWSVLPAEYQAAVDAVEDWLDHSISDRTLADARRRLAATLHWLKTGHEAGVMALLDHVRRPVRYEQLRVRLFYADSADILRDVFGNPFRPAAFDPRWRTSTAVGIAQRMYDAREFSAMPILADALQDAGCEDEAIHSHCRAAGQVHARGCWVCDLVLQKA